VTPSWPAWGRSATRYALGVLVTAAIVVVLAMPSEPAAWSVVALVVVLGATTGQSVTAAFNRMAGSVVGCVTGAVVQLGLGAVWLPVRVVIAVIACMLICRFLRITAGQRLGMALAGFFVFVPGDEEWVTVGWRLLATLIGIAVALIVTLVLWPATARDRLRVGIDATLEGIAASLEADRQRVHGEDAVISAPVPPVSALRPLVAERRYEPPGRGPSAPALSQTLDGLDLAVTGIRRLNAVTAVGPEGLSRALAPDLDPVFDHLVRTCRGLQAALSGASMSELPSRLPEDTGDALAGLSVDDVLSTALEHLRAAHLTPAADAAELRDVFGLVESLSLVAQGLAQADRALAPQPQH
jgi:hypothetical protein